VSYLLGNERFAGIGHACGLACCDSITVSLTNPARLQSTWLLRGKSIMSIKRGKLYVDSRVQGALARRIVTHWFLFFVLSLISLGALELFSGDPTLTLAGHLSVLWSKYAFFVILMLCILPTFVYDSMKLSNRFVGPILRLRESISSLANGDEVKELRFRDNDFWRELSDDFNVVAKRFQESK
jgi:hypothetical protein